MVDLVGDDEEVELAGDGDHLAQDALGVDGAGGVVRIDDEDAADRRIVLDRQAQVVQVRIPVVVRIEAVGDRLLAGVGALGRRVRRVGRRRTDHPRLAAQKAVDLLDGIAEAVEEDDVLSADLGLAAAVGLLGEKFAGFEQSLGRTVAVGAVGHRQVGDDLFHPFGNLLPLGNRVADILHVGLDAQGVELFGDLDDGPDLVGQLAGAYVDDVVAHTLSPDFFPWKSKKAMGKVPMALFSVVRPPQEATARQWAPVSRAAAAAAACAFIA